MARTSKAIAQSVNRSQLAGLFGVAVTTVDYWRQCGCPATEDGRNVWFSVKAVFEWRLEREKKSLLASTDGISAEDVKRRTMLAEMQLKETEAARATGEAVSIADFRKASGDLVATIRSKVMAFAPRYSPEIAQQIVDAVNPEASSEALEEARQVVEASLRRASIEVLDELSDGVAVDLEDGEQQAA